MFKKTSNSVLRRKKSRKGKSYSGKRGRQITALKKEDFGRSVSQGGSKKGERIKSQREGRKKGEAFPERGEKKNNRWRISIVHLEEHKKLR